MKRDDVLQTLKIHKDQLAAKYAISRLGIFGSTARDEASESSDIDIVVEMPPDAFLMVHVKDELEELLVAPVDLIRYTKYLNPALRKRIDRDAIYV